MKKAWFRFKECVKDRGVWYRVLKYLGTLLFALYFAAFRIEISESVKNFFLILSSQNSFSEYNIDALTAIYLLATAVWIIILIFLYGDMNIRGNKKLESAIEVLRSSIYRAPNINFFSTYHIFCNGVINHLRNAKLAIKEKHPTKEVYEAMFKDVLKTICDLSANFSNTEKEHFSADFMAFINISDRIIIDKLKRDPAHLHTHIDPNYYRGVLTTIESLSYPQSRSSSKKMIIPVIDERRIGLQQVPGPGSAFLLGECFKKNTADIFEGNDLGENIGKMKQDIKQYYEKNRGEFKSFASFSLTY